MKMVNAWSLFNSLMATFISIHLPVHSLNSLWPSDDIWWHRSGSTLTHVMACCLTAPSHYLNQFWLNFMISYVVLGSQWVNTNLLVIFQTKRHQNELFVYGLAVIDVNGLTHWGLVMPFGDLDLGQHWFRWWLVAVITWTNVDLSSVRSSGIHLRAIS